MTESRQLTASVAEVADVVSTLLQHNVVTRSDENLSSVHRLLGLTTVDLSTATRRMAQRGWPVLRPAGRQLTINDEDPVEKPYDPRDHRPTREVAGRLQLQCTGGLDADAHWADETDFPPRADRPGARKSKCDQHFREMQRARYISQRAVEAFDRGRLELRHDDAGRVVGVECGVCGSALECTCHDGQEAAA